MRLLGETKAAEHLMPRKTKSRKVDDELWPVVKDAFDLGMEIRRPFESRWILSLAFLSGKQYVMFNSTAHILQAVGKMGKKSRTIDNILLPRWRRQVADLIRTRPGMSVVPDSSEEEDINAAKVGNKVLKHLWRTLGMKKKIRELGGWIYGCGNGFLDDRWNPRKGPTEMDEKGNVVYLGDVDVGVWSPFDILVPAYHMGSVDIDSFPWLIKHKWRDLSYIESQFKRGKDVVHESRPNPVVGASLVVGKDVPYDSRVPGAVLIEYYHRPDVKFPKGAFITASNGVILQQVPYPYDHYNLSHFKDIDIPGVFWGKSTVDSAMPQQIRWNRTNNSIDDFNQSVAKGKLLAPKRSGLEFTMDDTHGETVFYKPVMGHKPELLSQKSLPPTYDSSLAITKGSVQDTFSQHEITMGTNKSDIRSGEMVSLLREQDSFGAIPSHGVFEEGMERVFSKVLQRIQSGYTTERMVKVVGRDNEFEVFAFKGSDLLNNTDVHVARQSSLPDSRVERQMMVERRYEKGLYGDPSDPEVRRNVMNMLEDASIEFTYGEDKLDEMYSQWENRALMDPEVTEVMINEYDNHAIHVKEHNRFRKSMEYQKPKLLALEQFMQSELKFSAHVMVHQEFLAQMRQNMLEEQKFLGEGGGDSGK